MRRHKRVEIADGHAVSHVEYTGLGQCIEKPGKEGAFLDTSRAVHVSRQHLGSPVLRLLEVLAPAG